MDVRRMVAVVLAAALFQVAAIAATRAEDPAGSLDAFLETLVPPPATEALAAIPDPGRKLLAARSYVRAGSNLARRWSWTEEEIAAFEASEQQQALLAEVAAVAAHFAAANPGYAIYVNTKVRSLDVQIRNWNGNDTVGAAGEELLAAWQAAFGTDESTYQGLDVTRVREWLSGYTGSIRASLAAPGLTEHGQALAIDFQVMQDGAIIAGANTKEIETVWRAQGWEEKLKASMTEAGPSFSGPLVSPDEPWHYRYDPTARELLQAGGGGD